MDAVNALRVGVVEGAVWRIHHAQAAPVLDHLIEDHPVAAFWSEPYPSELTLVVVAIEPVVLPVGNLASHIERRARRSNRRIEDGDRVDDARRVLVTGGWPAVVPAPDNPIELVVVAGSVHGGKQPVTERIEHKGKWISETVGPDRSLLAALP